MIKPKILSIGEPETLKINNFHFLPLSLAAFTEISRKFSDWARVAQLQKEKIRVTIDYDSENNNVEVNFSKLNDSKKTCQ